MHAPSPRTQSLPSFCQPLRPPPASRWVNPCWLLGCVTLTVLSCVHLQVLSSSSLKFKVRTQELKTVEWKRFSDGDFAQDTQ